MIFEYSSHSHLRRVFRDINYFRCKGQKPGSRLSHPTDCSRFIQCDKGRASDRPCPPCAHNELICPQGFLYFDPTYSVCNWANDVACTMNDTDISVDGTTRKRRSQKNLKGRAATARLILLSLPEKPELYIQKTSANLQSAAGLPLLSQIKY